MSTNQVRINSLKMIWYIIIAAVCLLQTGYVTSIRTGTEVQLSDYGYVVSISRYDPINDMDYYQCVGVIVHKSYVLSAAKCVSGISLESGYDVHADSVIRGRGNTHTVSNITVHPGFKNGFEYNIALFKLKDGEEFSTSTSTIDLPHSDFEDGPGSNITVVSYGLVHRLGQNIYKLQRAQLTVVNTNRNLTFTAKDPPSLGYPNILNTDLGAPAFSNGNFVGLVSRGGVPHTVFSKIYALKAFIQNGIGNP